MEEVKAANRCQVVALTSPGRPSTGDLRRDPGHEGPLEAVKAQISWKRVSGRGTASYLICDSCPVRTPS